VRESTIEDLVRGLIPRGEEMEGKKGLRGLLEGQGEEILIPVGGGENEQASQIINAGAATRMSQGERYLEGYNIR